MGGGLLVFKRGGERRTWGGRIDKVVKTGGGGEETTGRVCVGGGYGGAGSSTCSGKLCEGGVNFHFIHPSIEFLRLRCLDLPFLTLHFQFFKRGHRKR